MKITGTFEVNLYYEGSYCPQMGHSSRLMLNGADALLDTGENLILCRLPKAGEAIASTTLGSGIQGTVSQVLTARPGRYVTVIVEGVAEGSLGSITGGISCHAGWHIIATKRVEGRFGAFPTVAAYVAAKDAHRATVPATQENLASWEAWSARNGGKPFTYWVDQQYRCAFCNAHLGEELPKFVGMRR